MFLFLFIFIVTFIMGIMHIDSVKVPECSYHTWVYKKDSYRLECDKCGKIGTDG